jgi:TonB-dependent SusC/RagA subfamily outer membrane receptor
MRTKLLALALLLGVAPLVVAGCATGTGGAQAGRISNSTGAETTIRPHEGDLSLMDVLRTKAPGLQILQLNDGTYEIHIRGAAQDASGTPPPLLIVDGMPVDDINNEFHTLDPQTIDTVTILRDASSTSMYGTRGAGGVIVIRTKHR